MPTAGPRCVRKNLQASSPASERSHGVNANQLRNWVKLRRDRQAQDALTVVAGQETSAFVPVVAASPIARQPDMPARPRSRECRRGDPICSSLYQKP
ncbi:transposase [Rhizobium leguminosarum]|nr:transposase [Rhizobium leguminosarum]